MIIFTNPLKSAKFKIRPIMLMGVFCMQKLIKLKPKKIIYFTFLFSVFCFLFSVDLARAQINSLGLATYLPIEGKVEDGDIIVATDTGYTLSSAPYEIRMIGVISINPAISLKTDKDQKGYPVVSAGAAYVKVTGENGEIKKGDFITSSQTPGTGMKAEGSGYVVGLALDDATFKNENDIKLIQLSVNPHSIQTGSSLLDIFSIGKIAASGKPSKVLQYIVAAIITIITFGSGFLIFAKSVNTGLEALGRNPLASRQIQLGIVFNIILIGVIIIIGAGLAYIVIRL